MENINIEYGIDDYLTFAENGKKFRCKIYYTERPYIRHYGQKIYLDEVTRNDW